MFNLSHLMMALLAQTSAVPDLDVRCSPRHSPAESARRAVALGFLSSRAWLELKLVHSSQADELKEVRARHASLGKRVSALKLEDAFTAAELKLIRKALGTWSQAQAAEQSWAMQGAGTLVWGLGGASQLTPAGESMPMEVALKPIMPPGAAEQLVKSPALRDAGTLRGALQEASYAVWRLQLENTRRSQKDPGGIPSAVGEELNKAQKAGVRLQSNGSDLLIGGHTVASLDTLALANASSSAQARLRALQWLCQ